MALLTIMHAILAAFLVLEFIPFGLAELSVSRAPCMHLLNAHDSLFSVAQFYDSDWLTVWSLNQQLPQPKDLNWGVGDSLGMPAALSEDSTFDPDGGSLSEYVRYAKPYVIQAGETLSEIAVRFGTTVEKIQADSEGRVSDVENVARGTILCIVPRWRKVLHVEDDRKCFHNVALREDQF